MTITTSHYCARFGLTLPDAVIEVDEVVTRKDKTIYDGQDQTSPNKDMIVRCKVYSNQAAYDSGLSPIDTFEKYAEASPADKEVIMAAGLNAIYPTLSE